MVGLYLDAIVKVDQTIQLIVIIGIFFVYVWTALAICSQCFAMIYLVPDRILRWLGMQEEASNIKQMVQEEIGDGMSDNVSYEVANGGDITEARISQDEYIVDANQVKELGGGDVEEGTARLDKLREEIRKQAYGTKEQPNEISAVKTLEKFMGT